MMFPENFKVSIMCGINSMQWARRSHAPVIAVQHLILRSQETAPIGIQWISKKLVIAWGLSYSEHPFEEGPKILPLAEMEIHRQFLRKD